MRENKTVFFLKHSVFASLTCYLKYTDVIQSSLQHVHVGLLSDCYVLNLFLLREFVAMVNEIRDDEIIVFVLLNLQAAAYYCVRLGFNEVGYKGLETGSRQIAAHVVQQNKARIFAHFSVLQLIFTKI